MNNTVTFRIKQTWIGESMFYEAQREVKYRFLWFSWWVRIGRYNYCSKEKAEERIDNYIEQINFKPKTELYNPFNP